MHPFTFCDANNDPSQNSSQDVLQERSQNTFTDASSIVDPLQHFADFLQIWPGITIYWKHNRGGAYLKKKEDTLNRISQL